MTRHELETWLCRDGTRVPTLAEVAAVLGMVPDRARGLARPRRAIGLASLRFTIAVLRDIYPDDVSVRRWLRTPRPELGGRSCRTLVRAGQLRAVEALAVREWHTTPVAPALAPTVYAASIA